MQNSESINRLVKPALLEKVLILITLNSISTYNDTT